jgi:hypothetical protein
MHEKSIRNLDRRIIEIDKSVANLRDAARGGKQVKYTGYPKYLEAELESSISKRYRLNEQLSPIEAITNAIVQDVEEKNTPEMSKIKTPNLALLQNVINP